MRRGSAIAREREPDTYVPYVGHASPGVILLDDGSVLAMLQLDGIAWETADVEEVNARHAQRNLLLRNIASDRLVVATHVVRTMADPAAYPESECTSAFARTLDEAYRSRLFSDRLYRNELFLSILLRAPQYGGGSLAALLNRRRRGDTGRTATPGDLDRIEATVATLLAELQAYGPRRLGLRRVRGVLFSEVAEALRLVLTGAHHPVPLVNGHLGGAIYTDRVIVGREAIEVRGPGQSTFAAGFGLREYPASTWPGMFDAVLGAPYRCVLTQTFAPLGKQDAQDRMTRKQNQMVVAGAAGPASPTPDGAVTPNAAPQSELAARLRATPIGGVSASILPNQPYLLTKGNVIPCVLQTAMDSTLPGFVTCRTSQAIIGKTGITLLDRGSLVVGEFQGGIRQGQERLFVLWTRAETPNGVVIELDSPAADPLGRAGMAGEVDSHFWQRFGGALLLSLVQGGIQAGVAQASQQGSTYINTGSVEGVASEALRNSVNIPPTLRKNQGELVSIFVARDLDFSTVYQVGTR